MNYEQLNMVDSSYIPSMVKTMNNKVFDFWVRSLFQRACSTIIINEPEQWNGQIRDFLYYCLFRFGFVAVFDRDEVGTVFQPCTLYGYNFYYQPTNALIVNPTLSQDLDLKIGEECQILKLTPDYLGIWDIITYYAEKLATLDSAINMSIINNKFAWIVGAKNKAAAEALKKLFDKINRGEPAVFFDKKLQDAMTPEYMRDENGNFILDENGEKIEMSKGSWGWGSMQVEIKALTQAQADKILELVNTTTKVQNYDEELMQMITSESEAFFAGQKSAEDVGRLLQSKMTIYINEQR